MVVSGVLARVETGDGYVLAALRGALRLGSMADTKRTLCKLLVDHGRLLVDLRGFRLEWEPAVQVFASVLRDSGGWPAAGMVLFGADPQMGRALRASRIVRTVPVVETVDAAIVQVRRRPQRVTRDCELPVVPTSARRAREFLGELCADWDVAGLYVDAALVATELISDAVEQAVGWCRLRVSLDDRGLWIEVTGFSAGARAAPRLRLADEPGDFGRQIVVAIAKQWGTTTHRDGTSVWALLQWPPEP